MADRIIWTITHPSYSERLRPVMGVWEDKYDYRVEVGAAGLTLSGIWPTPQQFEPFGLHGNGRSLFYQNDDGTIAIVSKKYDGNAELHIGTLEIFGISYPEDGSPFVRAEMSKRLSVETGFVCALTRATPLAGDDPSST